MWQNNNGFGVNGQFQNNFNPDGYPPSPFTGQAMPGQQQQYFAQNPNMMQFEDANGEGFQPEVGLFNNGSYSQNQFMSSGPPFSPAAAYDNSPPVAPATRPPPAQINARAAELKAQLLALQKGRANSGTPPIIPNLALATKQPTHGESSSLRESPKTPISAADKQEQERNLTELISQYSEPKPLAASVKKENDNPHTSSIQRIPVHTGAKSQAPSLGSPTNSMKPIKNGSNKGGDGEKQFNTTANGRSLGKRHISNGSVSEGEISDAQGQEPRENTAAIRMKIIESQTGGKISSIEESTSRRFVDERSDKPSRRPSRDESPPHRPPPTNPRSQVQRNRDDYRDEDDRRVEKRPYESYRPEHKNETSLYPDLERPAPQHRDRREEVARRPEPVEQKREEGVNRPVREQKPPTLVDLLPLDEDLREWLEITGYHNATYRSKILNRRRAIAALDAQRDKLLAEMELDERGGVAPVTANQVLPSSMLPPPIPNKLGDRAETASRTTGAVSSDSPRDRVVSNKRPHSEIDEQRSEVNGGGKLARTDDRSYQSQRTKDEDGPEYRRPRSGGLNTPRRSPPVERREREPSPSRARYESRGRSRERDSSPGSGRRAFESRPAARGRGYEADSFGDREEFPEPRGRGGFMVRGNYRGRAYNPNYRARGQGTGRGEGRGDSREGRDFNMNSEVKNEFGYGSKIAGKPFKDLKGWNRGGRGDTRYFIVKSFNEENVLKCIQDGIWTTQVQNGTIFKDAFLTCKNVILIFSINKSRAFQGYARMESLPGSVPCPSWQRNINWESTGAFRVRWLVVCSTRFQRIGHLKNRLNDGLAVLIGKDGQEVEEECGGELVRLIGEEADAVLGGGVGPGEGDGRW